MELGEALRIGSYFLSKDLTLLSSVTCGAPLS